MMLPYAAGAAVLVAFWLLSRAKGNTGYSPRTGISHEASNEDINMRLDTYRAQSGLGHYFENQIEWGGAGAGAGTALLGFPIGTIVGAFVGAVLGSVLHFIDEPPDDFGDAVRGAMKDELKKVARMTVAEKTAAGVNPPDLQVGTGDEWVDYQVVYLSMVGFRRHLYVNRRTGVPAFRVWSAGREPVLRDMGQPADSRDARLVLGNSYLGPSFTDRGAPSTVWHTTAHNAGGNENHVYKRVKAKIAGYRAGTLLQMKVINGHGRGKNLGDTVWTEKHTLEVVWDKPVSGADWVPMTEADVWKVMEWWVSKAGPKVNA